MEREWLTMEQAQKLLSQRSRTSIYAFIKKYQIRVTRPMGTLYISYADIMAVMEANAVRMGV